MEKNGGNSTIRDMTSGSPVKLIIQFMIPMFLGNIFQQFYNIADSIVAGQFLGVDALAAIGSTGSLMFFVTGWLNGLSSGFAILVAQWFGAKKYDRILQGYRISFGILTIWGLIITVAFVLLPRPISGLFFHIMLTKSTVPLILIFFSFILSNNLSAKFLLIVLPSKPIVSPSLYLFIVSSQIRIPL